VDRQDSPGWLLDRPTPPLSQLDPNGYTLPAGTLAWETAQALVAHHCQLVLITVELPMKRGSPHGLGDRPPTYLVGGLRVDGCQCALVQYSPEHHRG